MPRSRPVEGVAPDGRRSVHPETRDQWRAWLDAHQDDGAGVWLVVWRKASGREPLDYEDAVLEALCVGWVDSTAGRLDDERGLLWFAPRKKGSGWARTNKARIVLLEDAGLMRPRGAAMIAAAKADGSWTLLDDVEAGIEPDDLRAALDADPQARAAWDGFPPSARKLLLTWVVQAKRAATRDSRIAAIVSEAHEGRRANDPARR